MVRSAATVLDTATLREALAQMVKHHMQQLLVLNAENEYIGEITTFTLAKLLVPDDTAEPQSLEEAERETVTEIDDRITPHLYRKVADFVEHDSPVMHPDTPLTEAIKLLAGRRLRLAVVDPDTNKFVGAISSLTVLRRYQF
jgi:CBS domain-containing protein